MRDLREDPPEYKKYFNFKKHPLTKWLFVLVFLLDAVFMVVTLYYSSIRVRGLVSQEGTAIEYFAELTPLAWGISYFILAYLISYVSSSLIAKLILIGFCIIINSTLYAFLIERVITIYYLKKK